MWTGCRIDWSQPVATGFFTFGRATQPQPTWRRNHLDRQPQFSSNRLWSSSVAGFSHRLQLDLGTLLLIKLFLTYMFDLSIVWVLSKVDSRHCKDFVLASTTTGIMCELVNGWPLPLFCIIWSLMWRGQSQKVFLQPHTHTHAEEQEDRGESDEALEDDEEAGEIKWKQLVAEIAAYRGIQLDEH